MSGADRLGVRGDAWERLDAQVGGRLLRVEPPLAACRDDPAGPACAAAQARLRNPFANEADPGAYQTTGWLGAYVAEASPYAVAATNAGDIAAAVAFARDHGVRLAVKGTGHDYLGRSSAPDSLLVWTHAMREVAVHDAFRAAGAPDTEAGVPAITVDAGTRWLEAYRAATRHGRFVLGGGCTSVGAAGGFTQGGGFGSFSKRFGTAAGNVLEVEVVTAAGEVLVANERQHADLFWALRGGGGGTFGVVSRMTLRTHPMPGTVGVVIGAVRAHTTDDYRRLVRAFARLLPDLDGEHWGEQVHVGPDDVLELSLLTLDLAEDDARAVWRPFTDWIARHPDAFSGGIDFGTLPFAALWDLDWWSENLPSIVVPDDRAGGGSTGLFWWATNQDEVSQHVDAFRSRWLPHDLVADRDGARLADALIAASRHWRVGLHLNKGLSGAHPEARARDRHTAVNPAALDAAALVIVASRQQYAYPGVPGLEPDPVAGAVAARRVAAAMDVIREVTPGAGAYVNEADYFEPGWQRSFWGDNYALLLAVKRRYDPDNLFRVHHGVGSEG